MRISFVRSFNSAVATINSGLLTRLASLIQRVSRISPTQQQPFTAQKNLDPFHNAVAVQAAGAADEELRKELERRRKKEALRRAIKKAGAAKKEATPSDAALGLTAQQQRARMQKQGAPKRKNG